MNSAALAENLDETIPAYGLQLATPMQSGRDDFVAYSMAPTASISTRDLFRDLAYQWKDETGHLSSVATRIGHPAYRKILSMGKTVIPYILEELEREPDHWFHALTLLSGENPIPRDFRGTVTDAADIWINWGSREYAA